MAFFGKVFFAVITQFLVVGSSRVVRLRGKMLGLTVIAATTVQASIQAGFRKYNAARDGRLNSEGKREKFFVCER
jgi:hypothetical protein